MRSIKTGHSFFVKGTYSFTTGDGSQNILINNDSITGSLRLPKGTTGNQINPSIGDIRFNTTTGFMEYYDGVDWRSIAYQQNQTIVKDTFTGDGVVTKFGALTTIPISDDNILVFVQGVFQSGSTNYSLVNSSGGGSGTLNYINFGSPPPMGLAVVILQGFDKI